MSRKRSRHDESEFSTQSSELSEDENGGIAPPPRKKTASTTYWLEELDEDNDVHEEGDGVKEPREVEKKRKKPEDVSIEIDHGDRQIRYCCPVILDEMGPPKYLPIIGPNGEKMTVESRRAMQMDETAQKMADWMKDVDIVQVADVTVETLASREIHGVNNPNRREEAQEYMLKVEKLIKKNRAKVRYFSTKVVDKNGELLVAVASHRIKGIRDKPHDECPRVFTSDAAFHKYMSAISDDDKVYDGLPEHSQDFISVHTQSYIGTRGVEVCATDVRHNNHGNNAARHTKEHYISGHHQYFLFESAFPPQFNDQLQKKDRSHQFHQAFAKWKQQKHQWERGELRWYRELSGVSHLDYLWNEQGKKTSQFSLARSKDLLTSSSYKVGASLHQMMEVNTYIQELLLPHVLATIPNEYDKYRDTYRAAALSEEQAAKPGFHTGHAIVYKQVVHQHQDEDDSGYCITFNTGKYGGGYLVFADLGMVFRYQPGDVLIFRSSALFHGVTEWWPEGDISSLGVTPGRVAHVFYTKQVTIERLHGKQEGWGYATNVGKAPDIERDRVKEHFRTNDCPHNMLTMVRRLGLKTMISKTANIKEVTVLPSHSQYLSCQF